jgi:hypothetical protein
MMSLTPPKAEAGAESNNGLAAKLRITNESADVTVRFSAVVGSNAVRVDVDKPETGIAALAIDFVPPLNSTASGITLNVPLTAAGTAYLPIEQGLPLASPGVWTVTVRFGPEPIGSKTVLLTEGSPTDATLALGFRSRR